MEFNRPRIGDVTFQRHVSNQVKRTRVGNAFRTDKLGAVAYVQSAVGVNVDGLKIGRSVLFDGYGYPGGDDDVVTLVGDHTANPGGGSIPEPSGRCCGDGGSHVTGDRVENGHVSVTRLVVNDRPVRAR